jgi:hypothetical protein
MKNTLWAFGDSMTFGHGCNELCNSNTRELYLPYKKDGDDVWTNHLSKLLNYEVKNLGKNGASNDYIFGSIIDNFDYINEGDIVIINMTLHGRIEVPIGDEIINALSSYENEMKIRGYNSGGDRQEKIETIINFQYHFSNHQFYKDRHIKRFNFIKNRLLNEKKVKYVYLWSLEEVDSGLYSSFETIYKATNGKVEDTHFSFNGHLNFAHFLYNTVRDKKQII